MLNFITNNMELTNVTVCFVTGVKNRRRAGADRIGLTLCDRGRRAGDKTVVQALRSGGRRSGYQWLGVSSLPSSSRVSTRREGSIECSVCDMDRLSVPGVSVWPRTGARAEFIVISVVLITGSESISSKAISLIKRDF